jgi:hypothetical protein
LTIIVKQEKEWYVLTIMIKLKKKNGRIAIIVKKKIEGCIEKYSKIEQITVHIENNCKAEKRHEMTIIVKQII